MVNSNDKILIVDEVNKKFFKINFNYFSKIIIIDSISANKFKKKLDKIKSICEIIYYNIDFEDTVYIHHLSHKNIDKIDNLLKKNYNLNIIGESFLGSNCKLSINKYILKKSYSLYKILFVSEKYRDFKYIYFFLSNENNITNLNLRFIEQKSILNNLNFLSQFKMKIHYLFSLFLFLLKLLIKTKIKIKVDRKKMRLIHLYKSGFKINNSKYEIQSNWMFENENKNRNLLYVIEDDISKDTFNYIKKNNLNYINLSKIKNLKVPLKNYLKFLNIIQFFKFLLSIYKNNIFFSEYIFRSYSTLKKWQLVNETYIPIQFISYNINNEYTYLRNILLNKIDCETIFYDHTANDISYYFKKKYKLVDINKISNNNKKIFVWNLHNLEIYKNTYSENSKIEIIGPLWTNFFKDKNLLLKFLKNEKLSTKKKYITFFPTSLSSKGFNNPRAHLSFLKLIENFIDDPYFSSYEFIFKTKNNIEKFAADISSFDDKIYNVLISSKRFHHLKNSTPSPYIIRISDLVINMAFSSTYHESLFFEKKTLFFDPYKQYYSSPFYKFDRLVHHNIQEMLNFCKSFINSDNETKNEFYSDFIKSKYYCVPKKIESIRKLF